MENIELYGMEKVSESEKYNMNFEIDREIIHDSESMLSLASTFICEYNFIKEQVERYQKYCYVTYEDKIIDIWNPNYNKIVSDYNNQLKFFNQLLASKLTMEANKLEKYIKIERVAVDKL